MTQTYFLSSYILQKMCDEVFLVTAASHSMVVRVEGILGPALWTLVS